jgi:hypothetical protein
MDKFWMCYVEGTMGCRFKHPNREQAVKEAERLARLRGNEGKQVFILETTDYCQAPYPLVTWYKFNFSTDQALIDSKVDLFYRDKTGKFRRLEPFSRIGFAQE